MLYYDITLLLRDFIRSRRAWEKAMYARFAYMTFVEAVEDVPELLGGKFRKNLQSAEIPNEVLLKLNEILKRWNNFRINHEEDLRAVRNIGSAHRDKNIKKMLDVIENMDENKVIDVFEKFLQLLNLLTPFFTDIMSMLGMTSIRGVEQAAR
jgi:hypothetical protein